MVHIYNIDRMLDVIKVCYQRRYYNITDDEKSKTSLWLSGLIQYLR